MAKEDRRGHRSKRNRRSGHRVLRLGHYMVITNAKKTEPQYFERFRNSIPESYRDQIAIKVLSEDTKNLLNKAIELIGKDPQFAQAWIILDRDQEVNFDKLICDAKRRGIQVGWSNPCFEIWLFAYLGEMPNIPDSGICCREFQRIFQQKVGHRYEKADPSIYDKLKEKGNEEGAIRLAKRKISQHKRNGKSKPSNMCPGTTVHLLISEIRNKTPNI